MSNVFFISDTHFGHKKVIQFEETFRPFDSIEEHDEYLVDEWNRWVTKRDTVWHLGDAVFGKSNLTILGRLNGYKRLVMGNHDIHPASEYLKYFNTIHGAAVFKKRYILTHIPVSIMQSERYKKNIHGHLHSKTMESDFYVNVSVERTGLRPIPFEVIQ